ncbi:glycosyltransferase family protein [Chryseobacterium sp.]|uniref:glycosyltransferase family protein n=1 Tax=Chryseobacterium sp. TaxID=1871047 RepID=UPI0028A2ADF5|nr:glycosyltransferase family protein [Chryseobacterium sp.]
MKILYAFQGTGNGHMARAQEIVPILKKYGEVDTFISGHQSQLKATFDLDFRHKGISLLYNKSGGISYSKILFENNYFKAFKTIYELNLSAYDLIINDYEPLTGWACKVKEIKFLELSHQASMSFKETPKPAKKDFLGEYILKYYVPSEHKIGFHFESYHPKIKTPVIRHKIRDLNPSKKGFYLVYLPSFSDENIIKVLSQIPVEWKIFSKYSKLYFKDKNVEVFPIDQEEYLKAFENCDGILCNAGFETPAEALFLDKKVFVIPIHNQYEQECNAVAANLLGVPMSKILKKEEIENWVNSQQHITIHYPDNIEEILVNEVLTFK